MIDARSCGATSSLLLCALCSTAAAAPHPQGALLDLRGLDAIDVEPVRGELKLRRVDLTVGDAEQRFELARTYAPGAGDPETFGGQWATLLDAHLERTAPEQLVFVDEAGKRLPFRRAADGSFSSLVGPLAMLEATPEGHRLSGLSEDTFLFDQAGRIVGRERPGLRLRFERDDQGRLQRVIGPWGSLELSWSADEQLVGAEAPGGRGLRLERDERGNLTRVSKGGLAATYAYDEQGRLVALADGRARVRYDAQGRVWELSGEGVAPLHLDYLPAKDPVRGPETRVDRGGVITKVYCSADGRRVEQVTPGGARSVTEFDARAQLVRRVAGAATWSWSYDRLRRLESETSPRGVTRYAYDGESTRLTQVKLPDGGCFTFAYDAAGLLIRASEPGKGSTSFTYDAEGRLKSIAEAAGARTFLDRDARGQVTEIEQPGVGTLRVARRADGSIESISSPDGETTRVLLQPGSHTLRVVGAQGIVSERSYDARGQLIRSRDARGNVIHYTWNACGRMVEARDRAGELARFEYDAAGRLIAMSDANRNRVTYGRPDPRTLIIDDPSSGLRVIRYDAAGRPMEEKRGGIRLRYGYDAQGNMVRRETPSGTEQFEYDAAGRLTSLRGPDGGFQLEYDAQGRVARVTNTELGQSVGYGYDAMGRRSELRLPWGTVRYERDPAGRVTAVDSGGERIEFQLDHDGRRRAIRYPNGVTTQLNYTLDRLTEIVSHDAQGALVDRRGYTWEGGRLASVSDASGEVTRFDYDARGRLVCAKTRADAVRYTYDAAGNRLSQTVSGVAQSLRIGAGNRVTAQGAKQFVYGRTGTLEESSEGGASTRYVYDHDDRLVKVELPDGRVTRYGYAPNGVRLWREASGRRTELLQDLNDVVGEYVAGELVTSYVQGPEADDLLAARHGGATHYYHFDVVRSVTAMTDQAGAVAARYRYGAFGEEKLAQGPAAAWNPYRYTSRALDSETGLYHYRARAYDPAQGRFTSPDPMGRSGGLNLYAYVDNAPTQFNDPSGLLPGLGILDSVGDALSSAKDGVVDVANGALNLGEDLLEDAVDVGRKYVSLHANFSLGFVQGVWSGVSGIYQMVRHPVATVKGVAWLVQHPGQAWDAARGKWNEYVDAFFNDPEKFARMTGHLTGEIALAVVGTKGVDKVATAVRAARGARALAVAGSSVDDVARAGSLVDDLARTAGRSGPRGGRGGARAGANIADDVARTGASTADEATSVAASASEDAATSAAASAPARESRGALGALEDQTPAAPRPRPDARPVPASVDTASGTVRLPGDNLNHALRGHTVENFDAQARLAELSGQGTTTLFKPGTVTNQQELVTLARQALDSHQATRTLANGNRVVQLRNFRGHNVEVVVGPGAGGEGLQFVSAYPTSGPGMITITRAELEALVTAERTGALSQAEIRAQLAALSGR